LPDNAALATFKGLNVCNAALDVDRCRRERKHFRDARAAPSEHQAEQTYFRGCPPRGLDEAQTFGGVEILPATGWAEQILAIVRLLAHANLG